MKKIDLSVLPDGFLIEHSLFGNSFEKTELYRLDKSIIKERNGWDYRPSLDIWHFNSGSMVLPDGLVVECETRDGEKFKGSVLSNQILTKGAGNVDDRFELDHYEGSYSFSGGDIIAIKMIGATAEYGAQLGMEVIEL